MKTISFILASGIAAAGLLVAHAAAQEAAEQVIYRDDTQTQLDGPERFFTGKASIKLLFPANDTAHYSGAYVTFEPGARSAWHRHPAGQHIIVTSGVGRTGTIGGRVEEIRAGDAIWCPPGVTHWHGAAPDSTMTHLVLTGSIDGRNVEWLDKVSDEQYHGGE